MKDWKPLSALEGLQFIVSTALHCSLLTSSHLLYSVLRTPLLIAGLPFVHLAVGKAFGVHMVYTQGV
jgi:hypothetical protein